MATPEPAASTGVFPIEYGLFMTNKNTINKAERLAWLKKELHAAYESARKGKSASLEVMKFAENAEQNIVELAEQIYARTMWGLNRQFQEKGFVYQICKFLWKVIIFNDPTKDVIMKCPRSAWRGLPSSKSLFKQPKGQGVAIGNLTSQLVSNIYLDQLDRYVTFELGFKHYGRYVDDFYIVDSNKETLTQTTILIEKYLKEELLLTLHPNKSYLQHINKGVAFLGAVVYPYRIHPGKRLKTNMKIALEDLECSHATEW